jgi:hypothetical protein
MIWIIGAMALAGLSGGYFVVGSGGFSWGVVGILAMMLLLSAALGTGIAFRVGAFLPAIYRETREVALISHVGLSAFLIGYNGCFRYVEAARDFRVMKVGYAKAVVFEQYGMKIGMLRQYRREFTSPLSWLLGVVWGARYEFYVPQGRVSRCVPEGEWYKAVVPLRTNGVWGSQLKGVK